MKPHGEGGLSDCADHAQLLADEDERMRELALAALTGVLPFLERCTLLAGVLSCKRGP